MTEPAPVERLIPLYSREDESHLLWYFGLGQTAFERSTSGGMLDRAAQFANNDAWPRVQVLGKGGACIGWESAITARPTAESRSISGYVPDEFAMTRYADVSRNMQRVERKDGLAALALSVFFGDIGQKWATSGAEHGRNGALYRLTVKGRALIEADEKVPGAIPLPADSRMWNIAFAGAKNADRKTALAVCARQAEALEKRARAAWHMAKLA